MKQQMIRWGSIIAMAFALSACGGGGGSGSSDSTSASTSSVKDQITSAAALSSNDTASNSQAPFTAVQATGVSAVDASASAVKLNFAVFSDGKVKSDLTTSNLSVAIAKLVPGSNGDPDQWVNYIYRTETATAGVGPNGTPVLASAKQATTDPKQTDATLLAAQLVYNPDGYYTYTFKTNIKDSTQTNGVSFDTSKTHRVAIQLSYVNAAGTTVLVNPYFDFTFDANGKSVAVTDSSKTRKMSDVSSCNTCHEKLALHGGGRVDTQYCVMCHNPGTTDANSGNNLNMATMVHKIHAGKLLKAKLTAGAGGEDYTIWGYGNAKVSFADVGFPQDLRNCTVCHTGTNTATPQGDNWKSVATKEACLTCHANKTGSDWDTRHKVFAAAMVSTSAAATDLTNAQCVTCHKAGSTLGADRVHWNQNEKNSAKYKMNIESASYDATTRKVTVKYYLSDPTNGNAAYNLVSADCTGAGSTLACGTSTKFGNLRFYLAYQNLVGQSTAQTEYTAYNNGGSAANAYAYKGTNDGNNHYSVDITLPADVAATAVATGTARVVSIGQVKEAQLEVKSAIDPRPEVTPKVLINVGVQHTFTELALSGTLQPRRTIVSTAKCNVCHGMLGTSSASNTLTEAFHSAARNTTEACVLCHDANRTSSNNMMTNGLNLYESYQFKRMIHGIHGNSKRVYPFTHGNTVVGTFNKDGTSTTGGAALASTVENFAAEVLWPGVGVNCNACHVNNSYKQDLGTVGTMVFKDTGVTDPNQWKVISPKAASCTSCHDSSTAIAHVTSFGGAAFGNKTQTQIATQASETCNDCHAPGGFKGVDIIHGLQ